MAYDIRLVKLINGDMVIGKFDIESRKINEVAMLQTVPSQQGVQMMLLPYGYPFDTEINGVISMDHILYEYKKCPEELKTKYLEATSNLTLSAPSGMRGLDLSGKMPGGGLSGLIKGK